METIFKQVTYVALVGALALPTTTFAYKTHVHQGITDATVISFENLRGDVLSEEDKQALVRGSLEEDSDTRPLQHFFNPTTGLGLTVLKSWEASREWAENTLAQANYCSWGFCQARIGYKDTYFSSPTDYSWERAIYEYAHGDKERGLEALGHILHLIQDSTVPAHVRNDQHLNHEGFGDADPYEEYTAKFGIGNVTSRAQSVLPTTSLKNVFDVIAGYTNKNFLSKDTFFTKLPSPNKEDTEVRGEFAYKKDTGRKIAVVKLEVNPGTLVRKEEWFADTKYHDVAADNWEDLSQKAVEGGVAVIDLFFREVAKEKQTLALLDKNKSEFEKQPKKLALAGFGALKTLYGSSLAQSDVDELLGGGQVAAVGALFGNENETNQEGNENNATAVFPVNPDAPGAPPGQVNAESSSSFFVSSDAPTAPVPTSSPTPSSPTPPPTSSFSLFEVSPGTSQSGGGGGAAVVISSDTTPPRAPIVTSHAFPLSTRATEIVIEGTAESGSTVSVVYPTLSGTDTKTKIANGGNWSFTLSLQDGANVLVFTATDSAGNVSDATTGTVGVDLSPLAPYVTSPIDNSTTNVAAVTFSGTTTPGHIVHVDNGGAVPDAVADESGNWSTSGTLTQASTEFYISVEDLEGRASPAVIRTVNFDQTPPISVEPFIIECNYSLSDVGCVLTSSSVTVSWDAVSGADHYEVAVNGVGQGVITATTTTATISESGQSSVVVWTYDEAGNSVVSDPVTVTVYKQPIIINEVAWAGTKAQSTDEWIELKNVSGIDIEVNNLALYFVDSNTYISLSGSIDAQNTTNNNDLYLIEKSGGATTADASFIAELPLLNDAGDTIQLVHLFETGTTTIDQTPLVATCGGWCAGSATGSIGATSAEGTSTAPLSMERTLGATDGALSVSWHTNDTYTTSASDRSGGTIYGTPQRENSVGLPEFGWFCDPETTSISSGATYTPVNSLCTYFSSFIKNTARRYGGLYRGVVGNAVDISVNSFGQSQLVQQIDTIIAPTSGERFFIAIWESRVGPVFNDVTDFHQWFMHGTTTSGATTPPHNNYRILEWVYGGQQ